MVDNFNKVEERTEKLQDLEERAEDLKQLANIFEKTAAKLMEQKKAKYEGTRTKKKCLVCGVIGVVVIAIIVAIVVVVVCKFV